MQKSKLKTAELWRDEEVNDYFLKLVYELEDEAGIYELVIPKIAIDIPMQNISIENGTTHADKMTAITRFNDKSCHFIFPDKDGCTHYTRIIKEKVHNMTLEEIENLLGYKINIINKEDDQNG